MYHIVANLALMSVLRKCIRLILPPQILHQFLYVLVTPAIDIAYALVYNMYARLFDSFEHSPFFRQERSLHDQHRDQGLAGTADLDRVLRSRLAGGCTHDSVRRSTDRWHSVRVHLGLLGVVLTTEVARPQVGPRVTSYRYMAFEAIRGPYTYMYSAVLSAYSEIAFYLVLIMIMKDVLACFGVYHRKTLVL